MLSNISKLAIVSAMIIVGLLVTGCTIAAPMAAPMAAEVAVPDAPAPESIVAPVTDLTGTGPDYPMMPTGEWMEIGSGEYQWYAFTYDFDEDFEPIEIRMFAEPAEGAILTLRNAEQAQKWREDGTHEHVGCCTVQVLDKNVDDDDVETPYAVWAGTLDSSGTYYLVVEHAKNLAEPATYRFEFASAEGIAMPVELYPAVAEAPAPAIEPEVMVEEMAIEVEQVESGPDFAMMPTGEWVALEEGAYHWYAFNYDFDEDFAPIEIRMYTQAEDSAILTIRNAEQAQKWRDDGIHEHVGCCTVQVLDKNADDDDVETPYAVWAGTLDSSGTYYIVVEHAKNVAETAFYRFEFAASEGVSFMEESATPSGAAAETLAPVVEAEPAAPEATELLGLNGSGPDFALVPTGEWTEVGEGAYHWYAFNYDFDEDFDPFEVRIYTEPDDGAILTIRNAEQAQKWRDDGIHEHVGCCSVQVLDKNADDDDVETPYAVWAGTLDSSGTYYIVVENAEGFSGTARYMFTIEGEGISY